MTPPRDALHLSNVGRVFPSAGRGDVWALRELNLSFAEGELTCILGPSGCGKTTLLRLLAGLDTPSTGHIRLDSREISGPRHDLAFVSQEASLLPWRRVLENIALGLEIRGVPVAERRRRAEAALARVQLPPGVAHSYAHELSGGMRQRVALARALCVEPRILLMDEPFARLDEATRHQLQQDLLDVWAADHRTILFVTHSIEEAVFLADRVVLMGPGDAAADCRIALPRPRDRFSDRFTGVMRELRGLLSAR